MERGNAGGTLVLDVVGIAWDTLTRSASRAWEMAESFSPEEWLSRDGVTAIARLTRPVEPFNQPEFAAPLVGLAGAILSLVLVGVAVSSLSTLLVALLALAFLLTRVYGFSVQFG
ncbi:MAG TPA: hypothetical protein VFD92_06125 [Candidatus Binatia bacterium]|nr:hypothetical protein [Candidatus Binatia bacterium]